MKKWLLLLGLVVSILVGACTLTRQGEGVTPLMKAAHDGNKAAVTSLIDEGEALDEGSRFGWTALMFAAWQGHEEVVVLLLDAGANPDLVSGAVPSRFETVLGHPPTTALREAIRADHIRIAHLLLDRGASPDPEAFALAGREGRLDLLKRLHQLGIDVDASSGNAFHATALCSAAETGHVEILQWLLEAGADPDRIAVGQSPLMEAIRGDQVAAVRLLLDAGADPNLVTDTTEQTPLFEAATKYTDDRDYAANLEIIRLLLDHGADPSIRCFGGEHTTEEFVTIQRGNTVPYLEEAETEEIRGRHRASLAHKDAVTALLQHREAADGPRP